MKKVPLIVGVLGLLVILAAFVGRFHGAQTVTIGNAHVAASSLLLVGNTLLLVAILMGVLNLQKQQEPPKPPQA